MDEGTLLDNEMSTVCIIQLLLKYELHNIFELWKVIFAAGKSIKEK